MHSQAVNINAQAKQDNKAVKSKNVKVQESAPEMSRKEKEAMEAARKEASYRKKHAAGETDEAKSDLARLQAIRAKRESDKASRVAREAEEAEDKGGKEKVKKEKVDKDAKPDLPVPTQKEMKSALIQIQECANEEFQKKFKLKGASGNKLAKMKYGEFTKLFEAFVEECSAQEQREYLE